MTCTARECKPGKTPRFQNRTQKTGFGGFNFGCQNCMEKRAELYFIEILEAKHLQPKF